MTTGRVLFKCSGDFLDYYLHLNISSSHAPLFWSQKQDCFSFCVHMLMSRLWACVYAQTWVIVLLPIEAYSHENLPVCCNCFLQKIIMWRSEHNSTEHQYKEFHTLPCSASDSFILCLFGCAWITFMTFLYFFPCPPLWGPSCWHLPWSLKDSSRPPELLDGFFHRPWRLFLPF